MTRSSRLRTWAERLYEQHARDIAALIGAEEIPQVTIHVERHGPGAAWTSGTDVFLSARWFSEHPDDIGGVLHEFTHAIMRGPDIRRDHDLAHRRTRRLRPRRTRPRRPLDQRPPRARQGNGRLPNDSPLPPIPGTEAPRHRQATRPSPDARHVRARRLPPVHREAARRAASASTRPNRQAPEEQRGPGVAARGFALPSRRAPGPPRSRASRDGSQTATPRTPKPAPRASPPPARG